jgi:hypothetical protein
MKIKYWLPAILIAGFLAFGITAGTDSMASAQDTKAQAQPKKKAAPKVNGVIEDFRKRYNGQTGTLKGPFDIVVSPTDKGNTGHKYSNVPYVQLMWGNVIAFPAGEKDHKGTGTIVYASNYTIETK